MPLLLLLIFSAPDAVYLEHNVILDCSSHDSCYIETTSELVIPLTSNGVQRYRSISASYRNTWESLEVTASISHWRSGRRDDAATISEDPHSSLLTGGRLESTLREVIIEFPGLETGDTLRIEIKRKIRNLPMADFYSYTFYAASRDSIHHGSFKVLWPSSKDIYIQSAGDFETQAYSTDSMTDCMVWRSGPRDPLPDLPFSRNPVSSNPFVSVSSHLPEEVSKGLYSILDEDCMVDNSTLADSIISIAGTHPEALCSWVSKEIEYLSGNWGEDPGYSPRNPLETLEERSGVCRDRAVLLLWLLRRAGYNPYAILTSLSQTPSLYPGSRSFNHMLVALEDSSGETIFLDPTNSFSPQGYTYSLRGKRYLPLTPSGSPVRYFPNDCTDDTLSIEIAGSISKDSSIITGSISVQFSGAAEELFRSMITAVHISSRNLLIERLFGLLPGAELTIEGDPSLITVPFSISGGGKWECGIINTGESTCLIIPGIETLDVVSSRAAAYILPHFRENIYIETPYTGHLRMIIDNLPAGIPELPEPYESENFSIEFRIENDVLIMDEYLTLQPAEPDSVQLERIRSGLLAGLSASRRTVLFR